MKGRALGLMRVRTVEPARVAFGGDEWGYPLVVIPILPGSTFYADRVRARLAGWSLPDGVDAYVSTPLHVRNLDQSITTYEVQGGAEITDTTLRGHEALAAWEVWCAGVGTSAVRR